MGGTGNTGQDPNKLTGLSTSVEGGGASGEGGAPQAPGATLPAWVPPAETAEMRPYELTDASTGAGAAPVANLGFPTDPMGFNHSPYPTAAAAVPTYAAAAAPVAPAAATEVAKATRKAADDAHQSYGVFYWNNPEAWKAQAEIYNSIHAGYGKADWGKFLPYAGAGWKPDAALQEYLDPSERW